MVGVAAAACGQGATAPDEVTWHADIHPIMERHCTRCHTEGGQAVGDFADLEQVRAFSAVMLSRMDEGAMPPPVADPECRDYLGSEHLSLPDASREAFRAWVAAEMPEGDPADAPAIDDAPAVETELADPDLVLTMPTPYAPTFSDPQNPGNEYRCFILDHGQEESFFVTDFHPVIGEPALVHHVVLLTVPESVVPDDYDPAVGLDCINGRSPIGSSTDGMIAGWAPGMTPVHLEETLADGTTATRGIRIERNQRLVVQMHYYRNGPEVDGLTDQSGYAFKIAPVVDTPLRMAPLGLYDFRIPANDADYSYGESIEIPAGVTGRIHVLFPHMHVLGTRYRVWRERAGEDTCIVAGDYTFDNQLSYVLREPLEFGPGDRLHLECTWDNSTNNPNRIHDDPRDVGFGERTDQEMCYAFTLLSIGR